MKPAIKKTLVVAATSLIMASTAQAVEFKASGQVSRMVVIPNDDSGDAIQHQDIGWSGSRFRFTGSEEIGNGITAGFSLEQQLQSNPSFLSAGAAQTDGGNDDFADNRLQDIYLKGGFGKVSLGKGNGAANGTTEVDLSGTALSSSSNHQDNWGNYIVDAESGRTWDSIFTMNDGISRVNRLRYDTPALSGITFSASLDQGDAYELAARYNGAFGGAKVRAALSFVDAQDFAADATVMGFSGSVLLGNSLNLTLAMSDRDNAEAGPDQSATTIKVGYKTGPHAFTVDFGTGDRGDDSADTFGATYATALGKGVETFATLRQLTTDLTGGEDVSIAAFGGRIKF